MSQTVERGKIKKAPAAEAVKYLSSDNRMDPQIDIKMTLL